jgi:hypothetical protein
MKLDAARSRVAIYTFAEGLLSRLAHDLELTVDDMTGELTGSADARACELRVPVRAIKVTGVMKRGVLDPRVLSSADRETIERQIREDVMRGGDDAVVTARGTRSEGKGEGSSAGKSRARVRIEVALPRGRATFTCDVEVLDADEAAEKGEARACGEIDLSLRALGVAPVKGPMGAFRVSDRVRVAFELIFV